jgi:hypothetical protein
MRHQTDDFAYSGQQYVQSGSGQFTEISEFSDVVA